MIAVWASDIADTFLTPRLNCPIDRTLFKSWGKLFQKQAPQFGHVLSTSLQIIISVTKPTFTWAENRSEKTGY